MKITRSPYSLQITLSCRTRTCCFIRLSAICLLFAGLLSAFDSSTAHAATFVESLPFATRNGILWSADHEANTLQEWEDAGTGDYYSGGGIFLTGGSDVTARTTSATAYSGTYGIEATITNAYRAQNGSKAVRYMRWTDKAWNEGGEYFPQRAYYSVWMYFPYNYNPNKEEPWDPGDGGWWNVFQFKSDNNAGSQPVAELDVYYDESLNQPVFGLSLKQYPNPDSSDHTQTYLTQTEPVPIPVGRWFHVEALYVKSTSGNGEIRVRQDGVEIFARNGLITALSEQCVWGIGNYTDHIAGGPVEGSATLYFDDAVVSTESIGTAVFGTTGIPTTTTGLGPLTLALSLCAVALFLARGKSMPMRR